jgi:large subunit ribosomal protein L25
VLGLPGDLPEAVTIDITKLRIGQSIRVGQIEANGLTILEVPNAVVVSVRVARGAAKGSDAGDDDDEE